MNNANPNKTSIGNATTGRDTVERFLVSMEREYKRTQRRDERMWCAILLQAWQDAFYRPTALHRVSQKGPAEQIKREARSFLTGNFGWERHRIHVCSNAEISPEWIREQALKAIENGPPQPAPPEVFTGHLEDNSMRTTNTNWATIRRLEKQAEAKKAYVIPEGE